MKLYELSKQNLSETNDPNLYLPLRNIINRGRSNNVFELIVVARLLQMLKHGEFFKQSNPFESNMSTSKDVLDTLRSLSDSEMVNIARELDNLLTFKDEEQYKCLVDPQQDFSSWIKLVHSREATD